MLALHEAEPRREIAGTFKGASIIDSSVQGCGCHRSDARDRHQATCRLVGADVLNEVSVESLDPVVEVCLLLTIVGDEGPDKCADPSLRIRRQHPACYLELAAALQEGVAALRQDRAALVHGHGGHAE